MITKCSQMLTGGRSRSGRTARARARARTSFISAPRSKAVRAATTGVALTAACGASTRPAAVAASSPAPAAPQRHHSDPAAAVTQSTRMVANAVALPRAVALALAEKWWS